MNAPSTPKSIVIVGTGQAGGEIALELRRAGHTGGITLVGEEPQPPYKRPPLSKTFLSGSASEASLYVAAAPNLEKNGIAWRGGIRATKINREARTLELSDGSALAYDGLALATGGRPRPLPIPGADLPKVSRNEVSMSPL